MHSSNDNDYIAINHQNDKRRLAWAIFLAALRLKIFLKITYRPMLRLRRKLITRLFLFLYHEISKTRSVVLLQIKQAGELVDGRHCPEQQRIFFLYKKLHQI
jgi:hypothetical protein